MKSKFYKTGVYRISEEFEHSDTLKEIYKKLLNDEWGVVHKGLNQYADNWKAIHFIRSGKKTDYYNKFPEIEKVRSFFECRVNILAFYCAMPGTYIHPHIDMSGHLALGRLRFHVPLKTNEDCTIIMGKKNPVSHHMGLNELWALDTSHTHSVKNESKEVRIHLLVEVHTNKWVWDLIPPRNFGYYVHMLKFFIITAPIKLLSGSDLPKQYYQKIKKRFGFDGTSSSN